MVQVSFVPEVTEAQIRELLHRTKATIVDGPSTLGIYHIYFDGLEQDDPIIDERVQILSAETGIISHAARE